MASVLTRERLRPSYDPRCSPRGSGGERGLPLPALAPADDRPSLGPSRRRPSPPVSASADPRSLPTVSDVVVAGRRRRSRDRMAPLGRSSRPRGWTVAPDPGVRSPDPRSSSSPGPAIPSHHRSRGVACSSARVPRVCFALRATARGEVEGGHGCSTGRGRCHPRVMASSVAGSR